MKFDTICIVGGGSSGWMTASTLVKAYPDKTIYLVESPSVSTIGVGESTTQFIRRWLSFLELKDEDWMPHCDATYKYSVRFENFNEGKPFHYPFGDPELQIPIHDWFVYRHLVGDDAIPFDETFWQYLDAIENSKYLPSEYTKHHSGFHFNAVKFAEWLRDNYAIPRGVRHIKGHVVDVQQKENGFIEAIHLDTSVFIKADLFFDCTGFKSLLLSETLKVPFESFGDKLLNTHAYAVQVPYQDKKRELKPYTNCTALSSGWVWTVPVWSRIGTGYNYSEKFISHEDALDEFKLFLGDRLPEDAIIRNIKFRTGISERVWEKNVVAIGLSGGFIEPLESNGLLSVHEWLMQFVEICQRPVITTIDIDCFNWKCIAFFKTFSDFVALHYALTTRCDTEYWKYITNEYHFVGDSLLFPSIHEARATSNLNSLNWENQGANLCIMAGHNYNPAFSTKIGERFDWNLLKNKIEEIHNSRKQITQSLQNIYDYYSGGMYAN